MTLPLYHASQLKDAPIEKGSKWIYAADYNVSLDLKKTDRIDEERDDMLRILNAGGSVAVLAHKGRFGDNESLEFIAGYLPQMLGISSDRVHFCNENDTPQAIAYARSMAPGHIVVMQNTRMHKGEEKNDLELAKRFAAIGDFAAIGGFGKSHRAHASNAGVLEYVPGFLTQSQIKEMNALEPWAGRVEDAYSVAVLGGIKKEKITDGLAGFSQTYNAVILGGLPLFTYLKFELGYEVGESIVSDGGKTFGDQLHAILEEEGTAEIIVPNRGLIAKPVKDHPYGKRKVVKNLQHIDFSEGVPSGYSIVDYYVPAEGIRALQNAVLSNGRIVLAGSPGMNCIVVADTNIRQENWQIVHDGALSFAAEAIVGKMALLGSGAVVLGQDSAAELAYKGNTSTGGGAALYYVAHGTTPVFDALRKNKKRFERK